MINKSHSYSWCFRPKYVYFKFIYCSAGVLGGAVTILHQDDIFEKATYISNDPFQPKDINPPGPGHGMTFECIPSLQAFQQYMLPTENLTYIEEQIRLIQSMISAHFTKFIPFDLPTPIPPVDKLYERLGDYLKVHSFITATL